MGTGQERPHKRVRSVASHCLSCGSPFRTVRGARARKRGKPEARRRRRPPMRNQKSWDLSEPITDKGVENGRGEETNAERYKENIKHALPFQREGLFRAGPALSAT